jgi:CRISPR/Cas system Type II protein with McrA/HNH and RuvC-like nuclease domain
MKTARLHRHFRNVDLRITDHRHRRPSIGTSFPAQLFDSRCPNCRSDFFHYLTMIFEKQRNYSYPLYGDFR